MQTKNVETRVVATLDELLYGTIPSTELYSDPQEFEEAQAIFEDAAIGKEFSGMVHYKWLKRHLEENYRMALNSEQSYMGPVPSAKLTELSHKRILAKHALDVVKGLVEDAQSSARPVFQE